MMIENLNEGNSFYNKSNEELTHIFQSDLEKGLNSEEIEFRKKSFGLNQLPKIQQSYWKIYIAPFLNFFIIILIISSILIMFLGSFESTVITWVIIAVNSIIAIIQQYRAQKALKSLKKISYLSASVIRNGIITEVQNKDLVPGDIILIESGDKIPADGRIIESTDLTIDEAHLTGESEPVEKDNILIDENYILIPNQKNMVFMSTFVDTGRAKVMVTNTGSKTEIGKISYSLNEMGSIDDIPLVRKLNKLGHILGTVVIINCIILIIYKIIIQSQNINQALIDSIIRAMNIVPVNLPLVTTLIIITGVLKMAQSGVIIKNLTSIESLGRVSVICSDKTGTITKNEMTVKKFWLGGNEYKVSGSGYDNSGQIFINGKCIDPSNDINFQKFIASIVINNTANFDSYEFNQQTQFKNQTEVLKIYGSPTEISLLILAKKAGFDLDGIRKRFNIIKEFPFSSKLKRMSTICQLNDSNSVNLMFSKGAAEIILKECRYIDINGRVEKLSNELRKSLSKKMIENANEGYRILSISYKNLSNQYILKREELEKELIFLGFVSIMDPPRPEVKQSIKTCKYAGIKVIMITGDHPATAKTIASNMGILEENTKQKVVEGLNIRDFKNNAFQDITVFSRVNPEDKEIIIEQYQKMNKIVAMTGDGVNDVLALKKSEIGIAMGIKGTDIAKETADMIISDDNFSSIVKGVEIGRGIFSNIRLIIYFFICLDLMEGFIYFFYAFNPMFNLFSSNWQHIYISTIIHGLISLGLVIDKPPKNIMKELPRNDEEILNKRIWIILIIHAFLMGLGLVIILQLTLGNYVPLNEFNINPTLSYLAPNLINDSLKLEMKARTMFFTTLYIIETNFIWSVRRLNTSITKSFKEEFNSGLFIVCIFTLSIHVLLIIFSYPVNLYINDVWNLNFHLDFLFLSPYDWLICILFSLPGLLGIEIIKFLARKKKLVF